MHELRHEYTTRKISPWGGIKYFHKTYQKLGLREKLQDLDLPQPGSNRGYDPVDLVEGFMTSVVLGARRIAHSGMLRTDEVIREIFGWNKGMASASTFSRFLSKFDTETNDKIFPKLQRQVLSKIKFKHITVDLDSTIIDRYGHQEGASKGYNPGKRGRYSHHPLMAFCDEMKMVLNGWLRSGDSGSATDAIDFIDELFEIVHPQQIGLLRGDVGFYSDRIMSHLEEREHSVSYLFKARMTSALQEAILSVPRFWSSDDVMKGAAYNEIEYQAQGWDKARRMVIVRLPKQNKKKGSRQAKLFGKYDNLHAYEYRAFVTNSSLSLIDVHRKYNLRADCENRIKELKYDFGIDGFAMQKFGATEAAFRFAMLAFNIMTVFKQIFLSKHGNPRMSTIRFQCIAIGSYLVKTGRKKKMKLSAEGKRRHFLEHIFNNIEVKHPPFKFPNA